MRIDLHTHSNVSDGTDTPAELMAKARQAGLDVVALSDHDTFDGLDQAAESAARQGIRLVPAMEMSAALNGSSVHLLAYGADPTDAALSAELTRVRQGRMGRVGAVLAKLAALGLPLTEDDVMRQVGDSPSVGRPHIADALVAAGYLADRREAFDRYLSDTGPAHVERYAVDLASAIRLVADAGGAAVIAHPWGRGSRDVLTRDTLRSLASQLPLAGLEVDHQDHTHEQRTQLRRLARDLGLLVTGSSDFHGDGKTDHDLGCNTTESAVFEQLMARCDLA